MFDPNSGEYESSGTFYSDFGSDLNKYLNEEYQVGSTDQTGGDLTAITI